MIHIGNYIRKRIHDCEMKQYAVADAVGKSPQAFNKYLQNRDIPFCGIVEIEKVIQVDLITEIKELVYNHQPQNL